MNRINLLQIIWKTIDSGKKFLYYFVRHGIKSRKEIPFDERDGIGFYRRSAKNGVSNPEEKMVPLSHGILFRDVCDGSGTGGQQTPRALFFLFSDCMDHYHRHHHDRHGSREPLRRKSRGQKCRPCPTLPENPFCRTVDRCDSCGGEIYRARDFRAADLHRKFRVSDCGGFCFVPAALCFSSVSARHSDPCPDQNNRQQP